MKSLSEVPSNVAKTPVDLNGVGVRKKPGESQTFMTTGLESYYKPIDKYEGLHRFDPEFEWEPEHELKVVRKIDKGICLIEGGFIPDTILYLSYFYTGPELPARLSWFWVSYQSTQVISAFLAFGILRLRGRNGMEGWRWLFALEGMLTGLIGIVSYFYLPPSPTQTASKFRGKDGWFSEHEEKIVVNRILRDDPSKGDMHNCQGLGLRNIWGCLSDWHMWPIYLLGLSWLIPSQPMQAYLTLQLRAVGFDTFQTNLLTIPAYALFILQLLLWTWVSEKINQRFLTGLISQIWVMPLLIALALIPARASSIIAQNWSILTAQIYRDDDKPLYRRGNKILIAVCAYNFVLFIGAKLFYSHINNRRQKVWDSMTQEKKEEYLATTKDRGNKRLDFRFAH
ncbi:hypothetical protein H2201_000081 [Coniosporium apollinis]|uniref:Transporter n=2 Tax=Coniosporium TaxID=2810619 RepID=A0ABQ9PBH7_9PEZI|nr:hypothetical protein H2199_008277 [Cladosporium sp. JES 115]KAJ9669697.1 hypothetical protein H2201_000081 [Coniosporium apollinis]